MNIAPAYGAEGSQKLQPEWQNGFPSVIIKLSPTLRTENLGHGDVREGRMKNLVQLLLELNSIEPDWGDHAAYDYVR